MQVPLKVLAPQIEKAKLVLITGHYGSGKTEFSVNLALQAAECPQKLALADLDIVNPYFRSRERKEQLDARGIRLIASSQACTDADVPSLPADVFALFQDPDLYGIVDVGGDPDGARVLARFQPQIMATPHEMLCVVNANRPETRDADRAVSYLRAIEATCGVPMTGLVNNTHLCGETTVEEILKGARLVREVSERTGLPVVCHVVVKALCGDKMLAGLPLFPIDIYMKKPWE
ncbi:MAG: hypothetical protein Q3X94_06595 [Oscillospiraceae bacterium]|nr:hypothetical protein [Oscillospiraceae bacterium]